MRVEAASDPRTVRLDPRAEFGGTSQSEEEVVFTVVDGGALAWARIKPPQKNFGKCSSDCGLPWEDGSLANASKAARFEGG